MLSEAIPCEDSLFLIAIWGASLLFWTGPFLLCSLELSHTRGEKYILYLCSCLDENGPQEAHVVKCLAPVDVQTEVWHCWRSVTGDAF